MNRFVFASWLLFFSLAGNRYGSDEVVAESPLVVPVQPRQVDDRWKRVDAAVFKEMKNQQLVGVSIGVILDNRIAYTKGYGWANREDKVPFSEATIVNWASNSKPVVAVRTMQLAEQGKLKLDDRIRKYVPELPKHCEAITIRHLLCHQSGYPHYSNGRILKLAKPIKGDKGAFDPLLSINRFGSSPLLRPPGEGYSYSSYAFVILSAILQRAGDKPLPVQLQDGILKPLGMTSFGLDEPFDGQKQWSMGYRRNILGKVEKVPEYANDWKHGAGAYKSNIKDFAKWAKALLKSELVSEDSYKALWAAQKLSSGKETKAGLGFFVEGKDRSLKVYHGGSHSEARSRMVIYPKQKHGIVVLCNCGHANPGSISTAIYQAMRQPAKDRSP